MRCPNVIERRMAVSAARNDGPVSKRYMGSFTSETRRNRLSTLAFGEAAVFNSWRRDVRPPKPYDAVFAARDQGFAIRGELQREGELLVALA